MNLNRLIEEARTLRPVPIGVCEVYQKNAAEMVALVDKRMSEFDGIRDLIGNNPLTMMLANHRHHLSFMTTVFSINHFELLVKTVVWVYRAYHSHGFKYCYFTFELNAWIEAVNSISAAVSMKPVVDVYRWLIDHHDDFCALAANVEQDRLEVDGDWVRVKDEFRNAMLDGNPRKCLQIAIEAADSGSRVEAFYLQVVTPLMYEIGWLWETGKVSVAQEHIASAIVSRVMTAINLRDFRRSGFKGKAVVTAAQNEFHELGAWMISDLFDQDGLDVSYLGPNTPVDEVIKLLETVQPFFLAVSATIPFNLGSVKALIDKVRANEKIRQVRVMVGGRCFNENPDLWQTIGADGHAVNASAARGLAHKWQEEAGLADHA